MLDTDIKGMWLGKEKRCIFLDYSDPLIEFATSSVCLECMHYFDLSVPLPFCSLFFPLRWWGVCAQRDSVESSVGRLQTCVKANPVSEGCSASQSPSPASSPVESVPIILSLRENRDTSALSMVCSTFMIVCRIFFVLSHYQVWRIPIYLILVSLYTFSDMCIPPFPFPCHKDADCRSTKLNYTCTCKPGFTGDGHNCTGTEHPAPQYE